MYFPKIFQDYEVSCSQDTPLHLDFTLPSFEICRRCPTFYLNDVFHLPGLHRRQPGHGGVPGQVRRRREPRRQRGMDPAARHRLLRLSQYCKVRSTQYSASR